MKEPGPIHKQFLEIESTVEANQVDMTIYRLERWSESRSAWMFVKRRAC